MLPENASDSRTTGVVDYFNPIKGIGFIKCSNIEEDAFFHYSELPTKEAPRKGYEVTFVLGRNSRGYIARKIQYLRNGHIESASAESTSVESASQRPQPDRNQQARQDALDNIPTYLLAWAYVPLGKGSSRWGALPELANIALPEPWSFGGETQDRLKPFPILFSYMFATFSRLVNEGKVLRAPDNSFAAFNTGLVDKRYESIYMVFSPNIAPAPQPWKWDGYCTEAEGVLGQKLVATFNPRPATAHYFENPADLLYDVRQGPPELSLKHVVLERIDRYPVEFLEHYSPRDFVWEDPSQMDERAKDDFFGRLASAIDANDMAYRGLINRVKDAVKLCIKRVRWNFKTAIPLYYPVMNKVMLMLPLSLVSDDRVDLALVVERTPSGSYIGHTVLHLDWAYKNARLICRPNSDWLQPEMIAESTSDSE